MNWTSWSLALGMAIGCSGLPGSAFAGTALDGPKVISISGSGMVTADWGGKATSIETGQLVGQWTLMAVVRGGMPGGQLAVFEDFSQTNGHLLFVGAKGVKVELPKAPPTARIKLRLRVPEGHRIRSVTANGKPWEQFDTDEETVTLPPAAKGRVVLAVNY